VTVNKTNKFLQSVAQFPFLHAILKLESEKTERASGCALSFCPGNHYAEAEGRDQRRIHHGPRCSAAYDYRAGGAQRCRNGAASAIDAVKEEGQYQAIKYLFEMIGLYPPALQGESPVQESLAWTLLQQLGLREVAPEKDGKEKSQPSIP
jgi:hypothetical protein